jgi:hypothetical protein
VFFKDLNLVLDLQLPALQRSDFDIIHFGMSQFRLDLSLEGLMLALKLGKMRVDRHEDPPFIQTTCEKVGRSAAVFKRKMARMVDFPQTVFRALELAGKSALKAGRGNEPTMRYTLSDQEREQLQRDFARLEQEHRDLDSAIAALQQVGSTDQLQIQRLKKRKLVLKDRMIEVADRLRPDIIA